MAATTNILEAVIISGPRKGEIISVPDTVANDNFFPTMEELEAMSEEELALLNKGLDAMLAAMDRLSTELRFTKEAFQEESVLQAEAA